MKLSIQKTVLILASGIFLFILLRIPSLFEPHWYGDEGIYAAVSYEMSHGEMLYRDIWDDKPPLIYWMFSIAGNSHKLFFARFFNLVAGVITIIGIYKLVKKLFNDRLALISFFLTIILLGLPILEGNIANGENFFIALNVWGFYIGIDSIERKEKQLLAGLLFAVATLFKIVALLDFGALVIFLIATETKILSKRPKFRDVLKIIPLGIGFVLPILFITSIELLNGNFTNFIHSTLIDMFSYVSYSASNKLIQIPAKAKILLLLIATAILILNFYTKKFSKTTLFITLVLIYEYFATIISDRHYIHYLLQIIPGFTLVTALVLKRLQSYKTLVLKINLAIIFLLGIYLALINFTQGEGLKTNYGAWQFGGKPSYYKTYIYYKHFLNYKIFNNISKDEYNHLFNDEETKIITLERALNSIFKDIPREEVYIYTNRAWTFPYLKIRVPTLFSVAYHRYIHKEGNDRLINDLTTNKMSLIVVEQDVPTFEEFDQLLDKSYDEILQDETYTYYSKK